MNEAAIQAALEELGLALREWVDDGKTPARFPFAVWIERNIAPLYRQEFAAAMSSHVAGLAGRLERQLDLPDTRAVNRLAAGRLKILDLPQQARRKLALILADGRARGLNPRDMVDDIAQQVPAGRYTTVEQRAKVIAREETAIAQNHATLDALEAAGFTHVRARDAQLGPTDAECEARDGRLFTIAAARQEQEKEHVNGTLSWDPVAA